VEAVFRQWTWASVKTFVMRKIGQIGFMDKPMPEPGPLDAVVRTTNALICTSDTHTAKGGIGPRENLTLGHEAVGVVHEVGGEVQAFRPGDRVLVGAITADWGDLAAQNGYPSQTGGPLGGSVRLRPVPHLPFGHSGEALPNVLRFGLEPESMTLALTGIGAGARTLAPVMSAWSGDLVPLQGYPAGSAGPAPEKPWASVPAGGLRAPRRRCGSAGRG
jgi:hypothetical protein